MRLRVSARWRSLARWVALGLVLVWLGLRVWALHIARTAIPEFEAKYGALTARSLTLEAPPDSRNGARYFEAAARLFDLSEPESAQLGSIRREGRFPLSAADREFVVALAAKNALAFELLAAGARQEACVFLPEPPAPSTPLPPVPTFIGLARFVLLFERGMGQGTPLARNPSIADLFSLTACLQRERAQIFQLTGQAVERMALDELHRAVENGELDGALLAIERRLPAAGEIPSLSDSTRFDLVSTRAYEDEAAQAEGFPLYYFWHPFRVRGFLWAEMVRGRGRALDESRSADAPGIPSGGPRLLLSQLVYETFQPLEHSWVERRIGDFLARETARRALRTRIAALEAGSYRALETAKVSTSDAVELADGDFNFELTADGGALLSLRSEKQPPDDASPQRPNRKPRHWSWRLPPLPAVTSRLAAPPAAAAAQRWPSSESSFGR